MEQIAKQIMEYAQEHYEEGGWDYVVECHTIESIVQALNENYLTTLDSGLRYFQEAYGIYGEMRQESKSYAF